MSKRAASRSGVNELECSICNEHFTKPKILPCGHLGCCHCLITWFETKPDAGCPLCRDVSGSVQSTTGLQKASVTDVVDRLPTDLAMAALVHAHRLLSQQHDCVICGQKASALCLDCNDAFCHSCQSVHTKQTTTRGHRLRDLSSLTPETLAAGIPATCADHTDKVTEVYCPTHGATLCLLCATTTHRQCNNVVSLQVRQQEIVAELQELSSLLKNGERKLDLSVDQLDQHIKHTNQRLDQALQDIQATYDRLEKALKDSRHREMDEVRKAAADIIQEVNDVKSELQQRRGKMSAHQTITQRSQQHGLESSAADVHAQLKDRVTDLVRSATTPLNKMVKSFTFTFDPEVLKKIDRDLLQIGKVTFAPVTDVEMLVQHTGFQFLSNKHGESNKDKTAEKTTDYYGKGFVFSKESCVSDSGCLKLAVTRAADRENVKKYKGQKQKW